MRYFLVSPFAESKKIAWQCAMFLENVSINNDPSYASVDETDFNGKVSSANTLIYGDLFPSQVQKVLQHREIISLQVHPDILALFNALDLDLPNLGFQVYLKLMNIRHWTVDMMTDTTDLTQLQGKKLETQCPLMALTKGDFEDYQHTLKNLEITDLTGGDETLLKINGKSAFNAYEILGYKPMTYEQVRQYQWYDIQEYSSLLEAVKKKEYPWHVDWSQC